MNSTYISGFGGENPKVVFVTSTPLYRTLTDFVSIDETKPGYILPLLVKEQNVEFDDIYVTSVVKVISGTDALPKPEEWKSWQENLWAELDTLESPKVIVCLGSIATQAVTGVLITKDDFIPKVVNYGINTKVICTVDLRIVEWMMRFDSNRLERFRHIIWKAFNLYHEMD